MDKEIRKDSLYVLTIKDAELDSVINLNACRCRILAYKTFEPDLKILLAIKNYYEEEPILNIRSVMDFMGFKYTLKPYEIT